MKNQLIFTLAAAAALPLFAAVTADRFGALYYPGETATFAVSDPAEPATWTVSDAYGNALASGDVADGTVALSHADLDRQYGTFKLTAGTNETWFAYLRISANAPSSWVGTGTHSSHGWGLADFRYLDLLAAAGIGVVRDDVLWECYDKNNGKYTFDDRHNLTLLVNNLLARGIKFHPVLNGTNCYYKVDDYTDAFAKFAAAFVTNFKGVVSTCDIYNEPHNFYFKDLYPGEDEDGALWITKHREVTRAAVAAMKEADPTFSPGVGVEDYWKLFKNYMLRINNTDVASGLVVKDDLVSLHTYGTSTELRPEKNYFFADGGAEVLKALKDYGGGASRIVITEAGWTTFEGKDPSAKVPSSTLLEQARYLVRFYLLARQHNIEFACQYDFMDDGTERDVATHNYGLVRNDYTPKPAFGAVAAMTRILGEATPDGSVSTDEKTYRYYDFSRGGRRISVAWSLGDAATVSVPSGRSLTGVHCLDMQGNEIAMPLVGGKLALTADPIYLVEGNLDDLFPPQMVSNVAIAQSPYSHDVTVSYDLKGEDAIVTVAFLTNGVPCEASAHVSGDAGQEVPAGTGRTVTWKAALDLGNELSGCNFSARVSVWTPDAPPAYCVIDLATGAKTYYEYESQLPGGIASDEYRTTKMVFRRIPAAGQTFTMGAPEAETQAAAQQQPSTGGNGAETQHEVTFTKDYYMGVFEVTQAQWTEVFGGIPPESITTNRKNQPEWKMAQVFTNEVGTLPVQNCARNRWLCGERHAGDSWKGNVDDNEKTFFSVFRSLMGGERYNLPTEAQWEFACRAGTTTAFSDGRGYDAATDYSDIAVYGNSNAGPMRVGSKKPNAWGLYDMHGNIGEIVLDSVKRNDSAPANEDADYAADATDPHGWEDTFNNVCCRGGNWGSSSASLRSASRNNSNWWGQAIADYGFRVSVPVASAGAMAPSTTATSGLVYVQPDAIQMIPAVRAADESDPQTIRTVDYGNFLFFIK